VLIEISEDWNSQFPVFQGKAGFLLLSERTLPEVKLYTGIFEM
jgi:hypothetical protein